MEESSSSVKVVIPPKASFAKEWSSDQKAFKGVPWGKAMMWIFLVSDTFVFSIFLISYMNRSSEVNIFSNILGTTEAGKIMNYKKNKANLNDVLKKLKINLYFPSLHPLLIFLMTRIY